jgi:hypothetical protein
MRVTSKDSSMLISGKIPGMARASNVFPGPGEPIMSMLWTKSHTLLYKPFTELLNMSWGFRSVQLASRYSVGTRKVTVQREDLSLYIFSTVFNAKSRTSSSDIFCPSANADSKAALPSISRACAHHIRDALPIDLLQQALCCTPAPGHRGYRFNFNAFC